MVFYEKAVVPVVFFFFFLGLPFFGVLPSPRFLLGFSRRFSLFFFLAGLVVLY